MDELTNHLIYDQPDGNTDSSVFSDENTADADTFISGENSNDSDGDDAGNRNGGSSERESSGSYPPLLYMLTLSGGLGGFLFGYDTGVVSGAMLMIRRQFSLSDQWHQMIVAAPLATAGLAACFAGPAANRCGRRPLLLASSVLFLGASVVMAVASDRVILLVGRLAVGVAIGVSSMIVPVYIGECAPLEVRGLLVTANCLLITGGQLAAALLCGAVSGWPQGWRWSLGVAGFPALLQMLTLLALPESPRHLVAQNRITAAAQTLQRLRPHGCSDWRDELRRIRHAITMETSVTHNWPFGWWRRIWRDSDVRHSVLVGCSLQLIQQAAGINTVMYYSASIVQAAGVHSDASAIWSAAVVASVNVVGTGIGVWLVERTGRRKLTLASVSATVVTLVLLAACLYTAQLFTLPVTESSGDDHLSTCYQCVHDGDHGFCYRQSANLTSLCLSARERITCPSDYTWTTRLCPSTLAWLSVPALGLYLLGFGPGLGPMPWTINAELYPMWARAGSMALSTAVNWATNLVVALTFLDVSSALSLPGAFLLYTTVTASGGLFLYWQLPETRNVPLEKVECGVSEESSAESY